MKRRRGPKYAFLATPLRKKGERAAKREKTERTKKIKGAGEGCQSWGKLPPGAEGDGRP